MSTPKYAAIVAAIVSALLVCFQLFLAAGLPFGQAAWGGQHTGVLPMNLRLGSLAAAVVIGLSAWLILARVGVGVRKAASKAVKVLTWVYTAYLLFNTFGNFMSQSPVERMVMTPTTLVLAVCFLIAALS